MTFSVKSLYIIFVIFSIALAAADFGIPIRALILIALFCALISFFPHKFADYFDHHIGLFIFCLALTLVGASLSIYHGKTFQTTIQYTVEEILQIYLIISCIYIISSIIGPSYVGRIFISITFISGLVAILQFLEFDFFWTLRQYTSQLQSETAAVQHWIESANRPVGLSYSTMNLAYQIMVALSIVLLLCKARLVGPSVFNWSASFGLLVGIATEVRSLILGVILSVLIYNIVLTYGAKASKQLSFLLIFLVGAAAIAFLLVTEPESRVLSVSDGSATGRLVLAKLGLDLAIDNPFGFGWDFDSRDYSWIYWSELLAFENANAAIQHGLHNYLLNFVVTYGVIGLVFVLLAFVTAARQFSVMLVIFAPYFANCLFHNSGPFFGEIYFWFAYGIFLYLFDKGLLSESLQFAEQQHLHGKSQPVRLS